MSAESVSAEALSAEALSAEPAEALSAEALSAEPAEALSAGHTGAMSPSPRLWRMRRAEVAAAGVSSPGSWARRHS